MQEVVFGFKSRMVTLQGELIDFHVGSLIFY